MSLLQVKRVNVYYIDLEKEEIKVPTVVPLSDGSRLNGTAVYELHNRRKLEKLADCSELVILHIKPINTVFIYGKKNKSAASIPAVGGAAG